MIDALITRPLFIIVVHDLESSRSSGVPRVRGGILGEENGRRVQFPVLGIAIAVTGHGIVIRTTNDSPSNWSDGRNDHDNARTSLMG